MKYKKSVFRNLAMVTQLGISVLAPIFLCIFIGYQVDSRYGIGTLVPLLILGVLAGGKSAWHLAIRALEQERREDEAVLREQQAEAAEPDPEGEAVRSRGIWAMAKSRKGRRLGQRKRNKRQTGGMEGWNG